MLKAGSVGVGGVSGVHNAVFLIKAMGKGINVICEKPISLKDEFVKTFYDTVRYRKFLSGMMHRLVTMPGWSFDD